MASPRLRAFLFGGLGAAVVLISVALTLPMYADYRSRVQASDSVILARGLQQRIEDYFLQNKTAQLPAEATSWSIQGAEPVISRVEIFRNGAFVIVLRKYGQVVVFIPSYSEGKVTWRCLGGSSKDVPSHCR